MSIGQVMSEPLDIVQAFAGIYARNLFSPLHLDRLERIPGGVLRREIGSGRIGCKAEDPARPSKAVNLHLKPLCFALALSEVVAGDDEKQRLIEIGRYLLDCFRCRAF
jgi:hypothetical protein